MFKNKAFLISLALLAFNFLLPNQVRSSPFRFDVRTDGKNIMVSISGGKRLKKTYRCIGKTEKELKKNCKLPPGSFSFYGDPKLERVLEREFEIELDRALRIAKIRELEQKVEKVTTKAKDIDFDSITIKSLPYRVDCTARVKSSIIQNKKGNFIVLLNKKKIYKGLDFDEALEVFKENYDDKCVE